MGLCNSTIEGNKRHEPGTITSAAAGQWKKSRDLNGGGGGGGDNDGVNGVVGRMVSSGCSEVACLYSQQGRKGINQDAMLVWEDFSSQTDTVLCGVFDGHGPFGHMVAKKVRDNLPLILSTQWKAAADSETTCTDENQGNESASIDDQWGESTLREDDEQLPEICMPLKRSMLKTCQQLDKELKFHPTIDCFCSGTTAVTLIKQGHDIVVGNIGDSRAVLATKYEDDSLMAVQLTVDLKPDLPREAARIQKCKGRVFALQDEPEVARVWLPNNDSPGLAMARAFGDFCLKDFGLISVPDIYYHRVTANDQFVILASDGVWDVLSNKEAVDIVASAPSRATSARALVDTAVRAWRLKYPTSKNDDCTAVCLFLEHSSSALEFPDAKQETHEEDVQETIAISNNNSSLDEIVPVCEVKEANAIKSCPVESKRTLAECLSVVEDDEWTALEGLTRVNSLLSIPRFLSGELRRSASWRKWL